MGLFYKLSGAYRPVTRVFYKLGGQWRTVQAVYYKVNGAWRLVYSAYTPPSVSIEPPEVFASRFEPGPLTAGVVANVTNGQAPFAYLWTRVSGDPAIALVGSVTQQSALLEANMPPQASYAATFRVTVTDARGSVTHADVPALFFSQS